MIKTFCDCCGKEMVGSNDPALLDKLLLPAGLLKKTVQISLVATTYIQDDSAYGGQRKRSIEHVCFACIADAVAVADKRTATEKV